MYFISGLPRSGSTLLCNILAQNPNFHVTPTSGILEILFTVRNTWDKVVEFKASPDEEAKKRVLKAMLTSFHGTDKTVFDKSRGWVAHIEMLEELFGEVKILVPVRDMRDVLSSYEKLWRKTSRLSQMGQEAQHYARYQTVQGRCEVNMMPDQPIGLAYNRIKDALARGHGKKLLFIDYEALTKFPQKSIESIYAFLNEPLFEHDFEYVEQVIHEDDSVHGMDLHNIRPKVEFLSDWEEILGEWADDYKQLNFWRK